MTKILHVLTKKNDTLPNEIMARQRQEPNQQVVTVDLTRERPDYPALLNKVFEADSVSVW